jgi:hypothetical protein
MNVETVLAQSEGPAEVGGGVAFGQAAQHLIVERLDRGRDEETAGIGQGARSPSAARTTRGTGRPAGRHRFMGAGERRYRGPQIMDVGGADDVPGEGDPQAAVRSWRPW